MGVPGRFSREHLMINRGRGDIRRLAARVVTSSSEPAAGVLGCLVFGAFVAAVGVSPWFALIPLFNLLFAFSDSFAFVGFNGIYQRRTPDEIRGRAFAAVGAVMTLATAVSFGFAGFLVEAVGWRPIYLVGGLVDVACAVALAFSLRWTPWRPAEAGRVPHTTGP
jgi:MFS family permease